MTSRPPMARALELAEAAARSGEVPVGAVVVRDGKIVAESGNRMRELGDPTAHAEMLAIRMALDTLGSERLLECDLYVTLEPCTMCAGAIAHARLRRLYYGAPDPKGGAVENGVRFFSSPTCHHRPEVISGVSETASAVLLQRFFASRR
jgi:tRNA(adenine34) deaminase